MAAAAGLSITLLPVLVSYLVRGTIRPEQANPINRWLTDAYLPIIRRATAAPWATLALGGVFNSFSELRDVPEWRGLNRDRVAPVLMEGWSWLLKIGRASCRERCVSRFRSRCYP